MRANRTMLVAAALVAAAGMLGGCASAADRTRAGAAPEPAPATVTPTPTPTDPVGDWVNARIASMSLEQKATSLLMLHAPGIDPAPMRAYVDRGIAGVIVMGDNVAGSPEALAAFTSALQVDPEATTLVAIDQEGGDVARVAWDSAPGASDLRALDASATRDAFAARGQVLAAAGVNVNFGIVADVTGDPNSFIFGRVLGTDAASASARVAAAVTGEDGSVASTLKHFPGHGAAPGDSHRSIPAAPMDRAAWAADAALPFRAGIDSGAELVMTGHLAYPAVDPAPASLSAEWHRVLRDELGFDGLVVTDDMLMLQHNGLPEFADPGENAVRAVAAGADLLLYVLPADPAEFGISIDGLAASIAGAVRSGRITLDRLDDAASRVLKLRHELAIGE